ncbi:polyprenyl synthetase family protein [Comamonadaceae bacterium OTU4NAUVB1]|nr:polyprenyl synthetase family protein [Comamonadaceae bacterium OTU4NAUVB1]
MDPVAHVDALRSRVDERLLAWIPAPASDTDTVSRAMHACVMAPGKRLRPLLLLLAAQDMGVEASDVIDAACALEMVHAASLALDDLPCMDDAQMRRGQPALHVLHGDDVAILAAVALLGQAFVAAGSSTLAPAVRVRCMTILAEAIGPRGLVGGQCRDLRDGRVQRSAESIVQTNQLKTGSLFTAAVEIAALAAHADATTRTALVTFACELGQAFQLADDIADACGTASTLGKDVGRDAGKSTLVALLGLTAARDCLAQHMTQAQASLRLALGPDASLARYARQLIRSD